MEKKGRGKRAERMAENTRNTRDLTEETERWRDPKTERQTEREIDEGETVPSECIRELYGHKGSINAVRFNRKGTYCMSAGQDRCVRLWNPHKEGLYNSKHALLIKTYHTKHGYDVQDIAIAQDNMQFSSCGRDKMIFVYDVATGAVIRKFEGHEQPINAIRYNGTSDVVLTGSYDKTVRLWDLRARNSYAPMQILTDFRDSVTSLSITNHEIIAGSVDECVYTFDLRHGLVHIDNLYDPVVSVKHSTENTCIIANCTNGTCSLIDKETGERLNIFKHHCPSSYRINATFSSDEEYVLAGAENGCIYVWDFVNANVVKQLKAHTKPVLSIDYHPEICMLVTASVDGSAKVWSDAPVM